MFKTLTTAPHRFKGILTLGFRAPSDRRGSDLCGSELAHFRRAPPRNLGHVRLGTPRTLGLASCLHLAPLLSEAGRDFPLPPEPRAQNRPRWPGAGQNSTLHTACPQRDPGPLFMNVTCLLSTYYVPGRKLHDLLVGCHPRVESALSLS